MVVTTQTDTTSKYTNIYKIKTSHCTNIHNKQKHSNLLFNSQFHFPEIKITFYKCILQSVVKCLKLHNINV